MEFRKNGFGCEDIIGGRQFHSLQQAYEIACKNFYLFFPNICDPASLVVVDDEDEPGSGFLKAHCFEKYGDFVTEIEFKDYRPIKRITGPGAKIGMNVN